MAAMTAGLTVAEAAATEEAAAAAEEESGGGIGGIGSSDIGLSSSGSGKVAVVTSAAVAGESDNGSG